MSLTHGKFHSISNIHVYHTKPVLVYIAKYYDSRRARHLKSRYKKSTFFGPSERESTRQTPICFSFDILYG